MGMKAPMQPQVNKATVNIRPTNVTGYHQQYLSHQPSYGYYRSPMANPAPMAMVQTNVTPQQNRFPTPTKPFTQSTVPKPNFSRRYAGTVTKLKGNIYCPGLVGEVVIDGKSIYEYCLKEGDGIEFKVKKSRYGTFVADEI